MSTAAKSLVLGGLLLAATTGASMAATCATASLAAYEATGFSCTVGDKTFSNFSSPQITNLPGISPSTITVTPVNNSTGVGFTFSANFMAGVEDGIGDFSLDFKVAESSASILGATLSIAGSGSFCDNETADGISNLNIVAGTIPNIVVNGQQVDCSHSTASKTFNTALSSLMVTNDITILQGSAVTSFTKLFVQPNNTPPPPPNGNSPPNDSEEPGSVIVFPKFLSGLVTVDGVSLPATEFEVGVVCPHHVDAMTGALVNEFCPEHQPVKIRFSWVCPAFQGVDSQICRQNNFDVFATVNGKVVFDPENLTITGSNSVNVPHPPCRMGYLIGYVISPSNDQPIKFDGLVGDEVIRESPSAVSAFNAIPIQAANETDTSGAVINPGTSIAGLPQLEFDGDAAFRHYKPVTGTILGDVKFTNDPASPAFPIRSAGFLTLLTLDVLSDFPNNPTVVDINWWNESNAQSPTSPLSEKLLSTSLEFICWTEIPLTVIDPNLTQSQMGTRKGVFRSTKAVKVPFFGIRDTTGPVTLLGIVENLEGPTLTERTYFYPTFNNSDPVPTSFQFE